MTWWERASKEDTPTRDSRRWLALAMAGLAVAGTLAVVLLAGRSPIVNGVAPDPFLIRRCLVIHVNMALVAWPLCMAAALLALLPASKESAQVRNVSYRLAGLGLAWFVFSVGYSNTRAVLSNYLPTIDNPLAAAGMLVFALGLVAFFLDGRLFPAHETGEPACALSRPVVTGLRAMAAALLLAVATLGVTWWKTPQTLVVDAYFEALFWGPGHMLQFVHVAGMLTVWMLLVERAAGRPPLSGRAAAILFTIFVAPLAAGPLVALGGTLTGFYRVFFTRLMQYGLAPLILVMIVLCAWTLARERAFRDRRAWGFAASALLVTVGVTFGALIRGTGTMIPAHFHATVGAVTVAYMAAAFVLLEVQGHGPVSAWRTRLTGLQPPLFALGQLLFASGFFIAGLGGLGRRIFCYEQAVVNTQETVGLTMVSLGGSIALAGGLLFLALASPPLIRRGLARLIPSRPARDAARD